jgi:transcriptional regulator
VVRALQWRSGRHVDDAAGENVVALGWLTGVQSQGAGEDDKGLLLGGVDVSLAGGAGFIAPDVGPRMNGAERLTQFGDVTGRLAIGVGASHPLQIGRGDRSGGCGHIPECTPDTLPRVLLTVYLPKQFHADDEQTAELLGSLRAADLVTATVEGLWSTFLPLLHDGGSLLGHVARANDHWRLAPVGESMVIVHGPDGYITPSWYAAKREHGKVVPTWNYTVAHIYGDVIFHDDVAWIEDIVRRLTTRYEAERAAPWGVDDAPREYIDAQLKAIVGVELKITRVEAKAKLGVQRSDDDVQGVIDGLAERGDVSLAATTARGRRRPPG